MALHRVPPKYLLGAAFASYLILGLCYLQNVVIWLAFGLALIPWVIMMFVEMEWTYKHFGWLALFGVMAFVQTIHFSEHVIEVVQVHIFNDPLSKAQAIFGEFNVEWVHFTGDTALSIGTLLLLTRYRTNPWLYVATLFQVLHQSEHSFLIFNYLAYHVSPGAPGLLARGGAIGGGLPFNRPDLHLVYNTLYTIPFAIAFVWQLKRVYDESLDEAFKGVSHEELLAESRPMETFHYAPAETVLAPGDSAHRVYVITEGAAEVSHLGPNGVETAVAVLHRGQYFGEMAILLPGAAHTKTVRAVTDLSVLAMDPETFLHVIDSSQQCRTEMTRVAREHLNIPATPVAPGPPAVPGSVPAPARV
ncbi:MAG: cyclic nucleotide-binding domain-containing protein [Jatrophihabitantaceae bacterium]